MADDIVGIILGQLKTKEEMLAAAKNVVYRTSYGRGDVIQVDWDDTQGKPVYKIPALGTVTNSFEQAVGEAASYGLNDYSLFTPQNDFGIRHGEPYNQAREMYRTIYRKLQSVSDVQKDMLRRAGIDPDRVDDLVLELITLRDKDRSGNLLGAVDRMREESSAIKGAMTISDDGARVLNYKMGDVALTTYQVSFLRNLLNQPELNMETFGDILVNQPVKKLIDKLGKIGKRNKGFLAARDIGLVGDLINDFLGGKITSFRGDEYLGAGDIEINTPARIVPKVLADGTIVDDYVSDMNILFRDEGADILARYAGISFYDIEDTHVVRDPEGNVIRLFSPVAEAKSAIYESKAEIRENYLADILDPRRGIKPSDEADLRAAIKNFYDPSVNPDFDPTAQYGTGGLKSRTALLKEYLINNFANGEVQLDSAGNVISGDPRRNNLLEEIFKTLEQAFDGGTVINEYNIKVKLRGELQKVLDDLISGAVTIDNKEDNIRQLTSIINLIDNNQLSQITMRGALEGYGIIKTSGAAKPFPSALQNVGMVVGSVDLKRDAQVLSSDAIAFSGLGDVSKRVYLNPMQMAFHANVFLDDQSIENMARLSQQKLSEIQQAINANQLPENIVKYLEETLMYDFNLVPAEMRESALNNRRFAESLLDLHRRGVRISDHPKMLNMLFAFFKTEAFRYRRGGEFQAVVPLTTNFAVATEGSIMDPKDRVLGRGYRGIDIGALDAAGLPVQTEIIDFRVSGGQLLFSGQMTPQVFHALGGYDNDDKVQLSTKIFRDKSGNRKLGFYVTRTPSGYQESVFVRSTLDAESVKYLFGHDEYFVKQVKSIIEAGGMHGVSEDDANQILAALNARTTRQSRKLTTSGWNSDNIEQAIIRVYDQMYNYNNLYKPGEVTGDSLEMIRMYGSSPLRVNPLTYPLSSEPGAAFTSIRPSYKSITGVGDNPLVVKLYTQSTVTDQDRDKLGKLLDDILTSNPEIPDELRTLLASSPSSVDDLERRLGLVGQLILGQDPFGGAIAPSHDLVYERKAHAGAILEKFYESAMIKSAEGGDILGVYINRTMTAGNVFERLEREFINIQNTNPALAAAIQERLDFGMLEYEEAIDLSNYFSGSRELDIEKIARETGVDIDRLRRIYDRIQLIRPDDEKIGFLTRAGEDTINQLGKAIGFMRASGVSDFGVNEFFLAHKLSEMDAVQLARSMVSSISEYESLPGATTADTAALALRDQLQEMLARGTPKKEIHEFLLENISPTSGALVKSARLADLVEAQYTNAQRVSLSSMADAEYLRKASTDEQALNIARKILSDHNELFNILEQLSTDNRNTLTETQKGIQYARALGLGQSIYNQIISASDVSGLSLEKLFNAFFRINAETRARRDIGDLRFLLPDSTGVGPEYQEVNELIEFAKKLARNKYYQEYGDKQAAEIVIKGMSEVPIPVPGMSGTISLDITEENLRSMAEARLERGGYGVNSMEEAILKNLAGQNIETDDKIFLSEASKQAELVRSEIFFRTLDPSSGTFDADRASKLARLEAAGTISDAPDDEVLDRLIRAGLGDTSTLPPRTKYERFSSAKLKNLLENKLFRLGAIGAAAAVAGSLIYSKVQDRTVDSISGPPLLPGGNPYESDMTSQRIPYANGYQVQGGGFSSGVSYKINITGSNDLVQKFNTQANSLFNGNFNTTIYNGLPRTDRDPYVEMGKIF